MDLPFVMTAEQVAELLGYKPGRVYQMARQGTIPHFRPGPHTIRFHRDTLLKWMEGQNVSEEGLA